MSDQDLINKMRALADTDAANAFELRKKAHDLEYAIKHKSIPNVLGAWARARRLWCDITGEELV